ncbi:ATP-binding protein [Sulfurimonas sp.]|uniref:PAS domain-containing hybrid sensor histidine kinase/response regulator n=1 Tax=Sulfurimonas sp. TaxID=2022749 RepID=UPI0025FB2BF6|nr:ATP-binding protein [Sulfurimonas sp.]MDD5158381.1 ATP-binding protein [Sulfurimonas sp.]
MRSRVPYLVKAEAIFTSSKDKILSQWFSYDSPKKILKLHNIETKYFLDNYANGVFDYFIDIIANKVKIGDCPVMQELMAYLKDKEIRADELFEICSHFRRSMIDFTYDTKINSKEIFDEISYLFDKNFQGVLKFYTDTIFQKEKEIDRHVKLLLEYQRALDESTIVSKTDRDGIITYVNEKYIKLSGYSAEELIGSKHGIVKHDDMPQEYFDDLWFQLVNSGVFRGTLKNLKKNGEYFYIDVTIVKITDPYDDVIEYMSIATDVTKLIDARVEAQMASQAKEYFLSNMSHEIRTPLNAILGFVDLLIGEDVSKQQRKYLEIILNSGENLLSIINDILDFSKIRSGEFTVEPRIFSIHSDISHTLELFVASANAKDITLTSFIDPSIPKELYADSLRLKQILSNFLSNAIKFVKSDGHIHVNATCNNKILKVSVSDNGIGISQDDIKSIFSPFMQVNYNGVGKFGGTGLGLSICNQLSKHMGGDIFVKSSLGVGSIFWIEIPVEIYNSECQVFSDLDEVKELRIIFYLKDGQMNYKAGSFLKYSELFNINIELSDTLDIDFDVAIFLEESFDEKLENKILDPNKKYISITSKPSEKYKKYPNISSLIFPLYCSKIKNSFDELLHPEALLCERSKKNNKKFSGHVLVAEDNEANQELIKILLTKYGLTYDLANNGAEAVELYKTNKYDLILMDEQMPIMDGNEAIAHILAYESQHKLRHTPVSALTANVIKGAKERGLKSGFDSFLGKPIVIKELERVFYTYLEGLAVATESFLSLPSNEKVLGLDIVCLSKELTLDKDELILLIELFIKKMLKQLPELSAAIRDRDYKKIAMISHSIKGSSANFRIESVQKDASRMEDMAKQESDFFDYDMTFENIKERIEMIKII